MDIDKINLNKLIDKNVIWVSEKYYICLDNYFYNYLNKNNLYLCLVCNKIKRKKDLIYFKELDKTNIIKYNLDLNKIRVSLRAGLISVCNKHLKLFKKEPNKINYNSWISNLINKINKNKEYLKFNARYG